MKRIITIILSMALVFGSTVMCFASDYQCAGDQNINYVHLGDSLSVGYGFKEYTEKIGYGSCPPESNVIGSYPEITSRYLKSIYGDENVSFKNMAIPAIRMCDIAWMLNDDYDLVADSELIMLEEILGIDVSKYKELYADMYVESISNADIITLQFGENDMTSTISTGIGLTIDNLEMRLEKNGLIGKWNSLCGMFYESVKRFSGIDLSGAEYDDVRLAVDNVIYAYWLYAESFDVLCDTIYELNPDADLYILGVPYLMEGAAANLNEKEYPAGIILHVLADTMNNYIKHISRFHNRYSYVDFAGIDITLFSDEFRKAYSEWKDDEDVVSCVDSMLAYFGFSRGNISEDVYERFSGIVTETECVIEIEGPEYTEEEQTLVREYLSGNGGNYTDEEMDSVRRLITKCVYYDQGFHPSPKGEETMSEPVIRALSRKYNKLSKNMPCAAEGISKIIERNKILIPKIVVKVPEIGRNLFKGLSSFWRVY